MTNRNLKGLFFKMSGYTPQEVDEMIYRQKAVKQALKQQKERTQLQKRVTKAHTFSVKRNKLVTKFMDKVLGLKKKSKPERLKEQIQNGFDLAKRWAAYQGGNRNGNL